MGTETVEIPWSWGSIENLNINGTNNTQIDLIMTTNNYIQEKPEVLFGISTGIIFILHFIMTLKVTDRNQTKQKSFVKQQPENHEKFLTIVCYIFSLLISPLLTTILVVFTLYRETIHLILNKKFGKSYAGILEGPDAVWAIEDVSKSILNVLAMVQCDENVDLLEKMREKMKELVNKQSCKKLSCKIKKMFGYYFWKEETIDIEKHVKTMDVNAENLQDFLGKISNENLPDGHETTWEILVGKNLILRDGGKHFPVIFRIHHAVGDGLALLTVLLEVLADNKKNTNIKKYLKNIGRKLSYNKPIKTELKVTYSNENTKIEINPKPQEDTTKKYSTVDFIKSTFLNIYLVLFAPGCLMMQALVRQKDENIMHGQQLTGKKTMAWMLENEYSMFKAIKKIKRKIVGTTFSDILLTAISASFYEYFEKNSNDTPKYVTTVVPARIEKPKSEENTKVTCQNISDPCQLRNRFSVAMLNLPIFSENGNGRNLTERLSDVKRQTMLLRNSTDYQINFWLLSIISKILPEPILRPMVQSAQSTMVISNIPGPREITICGGNTLKDLVFWLPNRGLTGIGVSVLSYGERIQLGLIVDKAIIKDEAEAQKILENVSKYIKELDILTENICTTQENKVE